MTSESSWSAAVLVVLLMSIGTGVPCAYGATRLSAPLSFEPNQGQADPGVQFLSRGNGFALFLAPGEIALRLERKAGGTDVDTLRMSLIGSNLKSNPVGLDGQSGVVNYFEGNDPKNWRSGIPTYGKVEYVDVYPGVNLVCYGSQRRLEYDFAIQPGADPSRIGWRIEGARAGVDRKGNLILRTRHDSAMFERPVVYQMDAGSKVSIDSEFAVAGSEVRFRLGAYDHGRELIIDPVLSYASYLGGTNADYIGRPTGPGNLQVGSSQGIAVDAAGSLYVTGYTFSADFPAVKNSYQGARPAKENGSQYSSVYVTKFSPDGSSLVYSTYLGGSGTDYAYSIAVDASGSAYVTGQTNSNNFPITSGAYQTVCSPAPNSKSPSAAAAPANCNSSNASTFVTKLNPAGTALVYSTFLGGNGLTYGTAIAVDAAGRAYVAGVENNYCTPSQLFQGCFPTTAGAVIGGNLTGGRSPLYAFMAVFDPTGSSLLYSTLFGDWNGTTTSATTSSGATLATAVAVDSGGSFYMAGETQAGRLPTTQGVYQASGAPLDTTGSFVMAYRGFLAKFNPVTSSAGASLALCTYLGGKTGNTSDYISGIALDGANNIYVAGYTNSADFPVTAGAYSTVCGTGGTCAAGHVTKLNPSAAAVVWSTFVGGSKRDGSDSLFFTGPLQLDAKGNVYMVGSGNPGFPLLNPVEPAGSGGSGDVVVVALDPTGTSLVFASQVGSGGKDSSGTGGLAVDASGNIYVAGNIAGADLVTTPGAFQTRNGSPTCCFHGYVAKISPSTGPQITMLGNTPAVYNAATLQAGGIAPNEFITLKGSGLGPATGASSGMTTVLSGASVSIGGTAAYLTYAQDGQLNALVPFRVSGLQNTTIQVTYNGVPGNTVTVPVVASSPGLFTQQYGPGQVWMTNQDGTFNSSSNPAARNSYVAFWVTGQGLVNATLADGTQPSGPPFPTPMLPVSVSLGGVTVPATNLLFNGLIYSGEVQINLQIPSNAPTGSAVPVVVTIGGVASRSDATMAIQ